MHPFRAWGRVALLIAAIFALAAALPATTGAQTDQPQCYDGVDNDGDGAADAQDPACNDEAEPSPYTLIRTVALPVVTLQGTVNPHGAVTVSRLLVRAQRGTTIRIRCSGRPCPFKKLERTMLTTRLRLRGMERKLRPNLYLQMRIGVQGQLGKYVSYRLRRNKAPTRVDKCLDETTGKVRGCFVG